MGRSLDKRSAELQITGVSTFARIVGKKSPFPPAALIVPAVWPKRSHRTKKAKKQGSEPSHDRANSKARDKQEKSILGEMANSIEVDFSGHREVLQAVRKRAKKELRSLNSQIIWLLMCSLEGDDLSDGPNREVYPKCR